ncbi:glycosyltransferase family 2 protein [Fusobacterium mortiferum]|uniref:glycosyltransferase family 2 protein n=1 Tax=Fusobacterium mortiferum TaxID=850 RepID=UPI003566CEF7
MENKKVSIIIPCYNVEKFIEKTLESAINQTLKDIEIIVINDGSIDNTLSIIEKYAIKDTRIKIVNQKNKGLSASRNIGIRLAEGEYIQHLDGDDWLEKETCEVTYNYAKKLGLDIVCYDLLRETENIQYKIVTFKDLKETKIYKQNDFLEELYKNSFNINCVSKLIKREVYIKNNISHLEKISLGEDLLTILRLALTTIKIGKLNKNFYHYILNTSSITNVAKSKKLNDLNLVFQEIDDFIRKENIILENKEKEYLKLLKIRHLGNYLYCKPVINIKQYEEGLEEFINFMKTEVSFEEIKKFELKRKILILLAQKIPNKNFYKKLAYINYYLNYLGKKIKK